MIADTRRRRGSVHVPRRSTPPKIAETLSLSRSPASRGSGAVAGISTADGVAAERSDTVCATSATELARCARVSRRSNSSTSMRSCAKASESSAIACSRALRSATRFVEGFSSDGMRSRLAQKPERLEEAVHLGLVLRRARDELVETRAVGQDRLPAVRQARSTDRRHRPRYRHRSARVPVQGRGVRRGLTSRRRIVRVTMCRSKACLRSGHHHDDHHRSS
jgi:hypothetical protein